MAYTAPTASDLKARFPAFAAVSDDVVSSALTEAARMVDETNWLEGDFAVGRMLYACHALTLDGFGTSTEAQLASQGALGFSRMKSGMVEIERATGPASNSASTLTATSYGKRFRELLQRNVGGPRVSGTPS